MALWLCCLISGMLVSAQAETTQIKTHARELVDPATQRQALEGLRDLGDPAVQGVLQALKEGALYSWKDTLYIFTDEGVFEDLDGKALRDASGEALFPDDAEAVPLEEDNISLVRRVLDVIDLFAPDAAKRLSTARRLANLQDAAIITILKKAQDSETDPDVQAVLAESINKLRLASPDAQVRLEAIRSFGASRAESALSRLKSLSQTETEPEVQAAIADAVQSIQAYLTVRNTVGYVFNGFSLASILLIMSLGLAITFGLMGIINMAHGEMLMLGSYTAYVLQEFFISTFPGYLDYYFVLALPLSVVVVGLVGVLMERGILRFLYGRPLES